MGTVSSLTTLRATSWPEIDCTHAAAASPEPSARSPRAVASEMVSTATRIVVRAADVSEMRGVLVERRLGHRRGNALASDLDLEDAPLFGQIDGQITRADRCAEGRADGAAADDAARRAVGEHRIAV